MKVIINADDLGISPEVNAAIFGLMAQGRVTSATLMANGPAVEEAAKSSKDFPRCSFGVHLNIDEFRPLTTHPGLQPILDGDGCLAGNALRQVRITAPLREAVFGEFRAQVERVASLGVRVSHLDSHHHMHTVPGLYPVLKRLQRRFDIRKVRTTMNIYSDRDPARAGLRLRKAVWNFALRHHYRTVTTEGFTSLQIFAEVAKQNKFSHRSVELMVHPGGQGFEEETRLLGTEWWRELPVRIEQISYDEL